MKAKIRLFYFFVVCISGFVLWCLDKATSPEYVPAEQHADFQNGGDPSSKISLVARRPESNSPSESPPSVSSGVSATPEEARAMIMSARSVQMDRQKTQQDKISRILQRYPQSMLVTLSDQFSLVKGVWAYPEAKAPSVGSDQIVSRHAGFVFVESAVAEEIPEGAFPVVLRKGSQVLGVLTGAVAVKLYDMAAANLLASEYAIKFQEGFDAIQVAYFQTSVRKSGDLTRLVEQLRSDQRVIRADLDVVESQYAAR